MSERPNDDRTRSITADRKTIQKWAEERNAVPAYREDAEVNQRYRFFERGHVGDEYQERSWDEFHQLFEDENRALAYREGGGLGEHEIIGRDEAAIHSTLEKSEVEERLLEGETVTTQVTETTVVEREIVETDTIESEVTGREIVRSRITDAELLDWNVVATDVDIDLQGDIRDHELGVDSLGTSHEAGGDRDRIDYTIVDLPTTVGGRTVAEVEEVWRIRREIDERLIVESRVVDVDIEEHDRVEEDTVETRIDAKGVQRSIIDSGIVGSAAKGDVVDRDVIETETIETGDASETRFESRLVERRVYEDEVTRRERLQFDFVNAELLGADTGKSTLIDSAIVEIDYDTRGDNALIRTSDIRISDAREGMDVFGMDGERVGIVVDVGDDILYVEPHPGFFERLEAALGWGSRDQDSHPVTADQIERIDDDKVVISYAAEEAVESNP